MHFTSLLSVSLSISASALAYRPYQRDPIYTTGTGTAATIATGCPTVSSGPTGHYPNGTSTATATGTSASPTYDAYEILELPCPHHRVLACCELAFDDRTSFFDCESSHRHSLLESDYIDV